MLPEEPPFWDAFFARADHALLGLVTAAATTMFLLSMWVATSWLVDAGHDGAALLLFGFYVMVSWPIFLIQFALLGDPLFVLLTGRAVVVPALEAIAQGPTESGPVRALVAFLSAVSPLAPLSLWAWSVAAPTWRAGRLARTKYRVEAVITVAVIRKLLRLNPS